MKERTLGGLNVALLSTGWAVWGPCSTWKQQHEGVLGTETCQVWVQERVGKDMECGDRRLHFLQTLKEFCTGVLKNGIIAGKVVKPKKFFLFCVKWSQRRCVWACRCVVFGKTRKTYLLENTIQGAVSFRVETHGGGALVPSGSSQPWMGGSSSWWLLLPQWN